MAQCKDAHRMTVNAIDNRAWLNAVISFGKLCARLKALTASSGSYFSDLRYLGISRRAAWRAERIATRWAAVEAVTASMSALCNVRNLKAMLEELDDLLEARDIEKLLRNGEWCGLSLNKLSGMGDKEFERVLCKFITAANQQATHPKKRPNVGGA